ncbi:hypothetical protein F4778DRAFT_790009 [Xylariomycetidae sp. FL2044]|nr:hypothetical protein F4778DRAFT_790009 [Xylariomycetidae sp. FL2044]
MPGFRPLLLSFLAILPPRRTIATTTTTTCYYPNGQPSQDDVPCLDGGSSAASHCCAPASVCLTNGLCMSFTQPYVLSRGSCTDQTWVSPRCPINQAGGCVIAFFNVSGGTSEYCCGRVIGDPGTDGVVKCHSGDPFTVADGEMIAGRAGLAQLVVSAAAAGASTAAAISGGSGGGGGAPSAGRCPDPDTALGVGLGVSLGIFLLATVSWAVLGRRQRHRVHALEALLVSTNVSSRKHTTPAATTTTTTMGAAGFKGPQELESSPKSPQEMEAPVIPHELH